MKRKIQTILLTAAGVAAGALLHECQTRRPAQPAEQQGYTVIDTIPYYDTIRYYLPVAKREAALGTRITFLPVFIPSGGNNDSVNLAGPDSIAVEIPITQKEYEGEEYRAWVSGYEPRLDSVYVFPRHDVVTVREAARADCGKPKRWGIGVFAGYGVTPHGFQPCAGISINYNLWNF